MTSKIQVSKALLIGLAGVAAAAVLAAAFLLGRESSRGGLAGPPKEPASAGVAPVDPGPSPERAQAPAPALPAPGLPLPPMAPAPAPAAPRANPTLPGNPLRAAVAAYFQAVAAIQPEFSGNPENVAQQIVGGLGKGDTSGIDGMIQQAQDARNRMAAITPPQPCADYHHESLANLDAGLDLMASIKTALAASDPSAPGLDITDRANALKARSEALQRQEQALKQRYCE